MAAMRQSPSDKKEYRSFTLPTGLEVLLVSTHALTLSRGGDVKTAKSAAALTVQVGSFADPLEAQGCAHFLEHMVFMGSRKYPKENGYDNYITSHGGACNAMTEGEFTTYLFDIDAEFFPKALDMFAHCFASPLLHEAASDREINAIESEFRLACTSDSTRVDQLLLQAATEGHVVRKFGWGSLESLAVSPRKQGVEIHQILRAFHAKHYHPQVTLPNPNPNPPCPDSYPPKRRLGKRPPPFHDKS